MPEIIITCVPPDNCCDLPYHWVQWRTPYRRDKPQPWMWSPSEQLWTANAGTKYTPERASLLQWHYLEPAFPSSDRPLWRLVTPDQRAQITEQLARMLTAQHFAVRFMKPIDDTLVQAATENQWKEIGLIRVPGLLEVIYDVKS